MCDPVTAATLLLSTAGSTYFQNKAADAVESRRRQVLDASDRDLEGFRSTAAQNFQKSLESATPESIEQANKTASENREQIYVEDIQADELLPAAASGSDAAKRAIVKALDQGAETSKDRARRRASFDSYSDALFGRNIDFSRARQNIGQQANFAQGRAGVTNLELAAADAAGSRYANLAGIVSALGSLGSAAAGSGLFAPAGGNSIANPNIRGTRYLLG